MSLARRKTKIQPNSQHNMLVRKRFDLILKSTGMKLFYMDIVVRKITRENHYACGNTYCAKYIPLYILRLYCVYVFFSQAIENKDSVGSIDCN